MKRFIVLLAVILGILISGAAIAESRLLQMGDYRSIPLELADVVVEEAEVEEEVQRMLSMYASVGPNGERKIPELTDAFAQEHLGCADAQQYREKLRQILADEAQERMLDAAKTEFLTNLIEASSFELDEAEEESRFESYRVMYEGYMRQAKLNWEDFCSEYFNLSATEFEDAIHAQCEYDMCSGLLIDALMDELEIEIGEEEFWQKKADFAEQYGLSDAELQSRYGDVQLRRIFCTEEMWGKLFEME